VPDLYQWWGSDIQVSPSGDIAPVDGLDRGNQRVLRRLLTSPGDYLWHSDYGAGLGKMVGKTTDVNTINALINSQIMAESCVAKNPLPQIHVAPITNGIYINIKYTNSETGSQSTLAFDVTED